MAAESDSQGTGIVREALRHLVRSALPERVLTMLTGRLVCACLCALLPLAVGCGARAVSPAVRGGWCREVFRRARAKRVELRAPVLALCCLTSSRLRHWQTWLCPAALRLRKTHNNLASSNFRLVLHARCSHAIVMWKNKPTLSGGSLGSWVDEERSKMRVVVLTAGHDHRHFERTLRPGSNPLATPV